MPAPKNNNTENKSQVSLIPLDLIVPMLEPAYREGVLKYQRESWRLGFNSTVMYDALMRHLTAWFFKLESFDPETKEKYGIDKHHLGAAMFCLINLYATDIKFPELDDRPLKKVEDLSSYMLNELDEEDSDNDPINKFEKENTFKFEKGNKVSYGQDFSVRKGVPSDVDFEVAVFTDAAFQLRAPGYGKSGDYGNGCLYVYPGKDKELFDRLKEVAKQLPKR